MDKIELIDYLPEDTDDMDLFIMDLPGEILLIIYDHLDFISMTQFVRVCQDFYYLTTDAQKTDILGNRRLYAYQYRAVSYILNFITKDTNNIIRFNAVKGYGKTLVGLYLAYSLRDQYNCFIIVPNEKTLGRFMEELTSCGLYNSDPAKCDFVVGVKTRKKHWEAFKEAVITGSSKVRITSVNRISMISVNNLMFISDEKHANKMNFIIQDVDKEISLSATTINDDKPYLSYYRPMESRNIEYIITVLPNDVIVWLRSLNIEENPIVVLDSHTLNRIKPTYKNEFNFWAGTGSITLKKYAKNKCVTIIPSSIVEGINFNKSSRLIIATSLNHIRTGRLVQLFGRVIRESSIIQDFIIETIDMHDLRGNISIRIAIDIIRFGRRDDDPKMKPTNDIDKIYGALQKQLHELSDKDLLYLFFITETVWNDINSESMLTIEELLNIGFLL